MNNRNIINRNTLPDLLSEEEFEYYFIKFKEGSFETLDILVEHNIKLVYWYIDNFIKLDDNINNFNDIFSVGLEALVESFYSYDITKKVKFSTYAITCIRNKILKYFRTEKKHHKIVSYDNFIDVEDSEESFLDLIIDDSINIEEDFIDFELNIYYRNIINSSLELLNDTDREIIKLYFGFYDGKIHTQREISEILGISQSNVSKRFTSTLKRIKNIIIEKELVHKPLVFVKKIA